MEIKQSKFGKEHVCKSGKVVRTSRGDVVFLKLNGEQSEIQRVRRGRLYSAKIKTPGSNQWYCRRALEFLAQIG